MVPNCTLLHYTLPNFPTSLCGSTHTCAHACTHTHTRTHARTRTHVHTHIHTLYAEPYKLYPFYSVLTCANLPYKYHTAMHMCTCVAVYSSTSFQLSNVHRSHSSGTELVVPRPSCHHSCTEAHS